MTTRALLLLTLLTACGTAQPLVRLDGAAPPRPSGPPTLEKALDLGSLPLRGTGPLPLENADGWFTPGEYVALIGTGLGPGTRVDLGGHALSIDGFLEEGLLLGRLPRGFTPGAYPLTVDNGFGTATVTVDVTSFVWGADTRGDALRFNVLGVEESRFATRPMKIDFPKARYAALSPDGSLLFALQEPNYDGAFMPDAIESVTDLVAAARDAAARCQVMVVQMGARGGPKKASALTLELTTRPTAIAAGPRGLVVAMERRLLWIIDANDPLAPRVVAKLEVVQGEPREVVDAEFLEGGKKLVVLEAYENKLHLVDLSDPAAPKVTSALSLADAQSEPLPDGRSVCALQGPNLRLAGKKLKEGVKNVWSSAKVGFKTAPGAGEPPLQTLSRVVEVELGPSGLTLTRSVPLPADVFPFFVASDSEGKLYVSALHGENPFDGLSANLGGVKKLLVGLRDTAQFSRVIELDPRSGETRTVLQSMAIYYEVVMLPTGRLLASLTRLGPGFIPPRVTLDWGFEIVDGQFVKLREVANTSFGLVDAVARVLPPYRYERVGAQ
jgi:hypothetical protein